ncbi:helix-turn-helix transcriptional regulator [Actinomadura parmotrematis]|uniref:AAA family ATPase n=1 Tax=Actinomadura parmotrematis TaxID=2864039 RepID=A0ABS7FK36_9ACTN|nr:LuxR family transcriptional regulator [Actinomadura parmotrematis]MBW8480740.1 AAA family ATPase [Actinomadura parmotrematis]
MALIGRGAELDRVLEVTGSGGDGALLVLGEAGAGKSALLDEAAARLARAGRLVLRAEGGESEAPYSLACLHQLLLPLHPHLAGLPAHLRTTLEAAFGLVPAERAPDPMLLRIAVLTLLTGVSRGRPVALVVDDVHHCDRDSAEVLGFVLRRLAGADVAVLLAARGGQPGRDALSPALHGPPVLALGPLGAPDAARLLDRQPLPPAGRARLELLEQARGNPLAIVELCRAARRRPAPDAPDAADASRVQELYAARLRALPAATRRAVLYAAAGEHEDLATVMRAAGHGSDLAVWQPAEEAGLVAVGEDRVRFRHPLARTTAYRTATARLRQEAHHAFAEALGGDPERRAWHRAGAGVGPDEAIAADLEAAAALAEGRGDWFAAGRALERAAESSPAAPDRARRYARALHAADRAGDRSWVLDLHARVTALTGDTDLLGPTTGGAALALSLASRQREAGRLVLGALEDAPPRDGRTALALVSVLGAVAYQSGLPRFRRPLAGLLGRIPPGAGGAPADLDDETCAAMRDVVLATADPAANARVLLDRARPGGTATELLCAGSVAWFADESERCADALRRAFDALRPAGAMGSAATCLVPFAASLIDTGRWAEAATALEEAAALATVHHLTHIEVDAAALGAVLAALRGRPAELPGASWTAVDLNENRATHALLLRAAAARAEAAGDLDEAFRLLRALFADDGEPLHYVLSGRSIAELASLALRTGRQGEAAAPLAAVREAAGPRPSKRATLLLHHASALLDDAPDGLAEGSAAERAFRLAAVDPAAEQWPLDRARARLDYARWLRRRRRPLDARPLLAAALDAFTRLGAAPQAAEAAAELRASGVPTAAPAGPSGAGPLAALTAQQQQIVRLAATGLSNREIADRLTLSPRTIGSHLYQAYPKLGVSSRHQLRDIVAGG